jgi:hypothetical protein
VNTAGIAPGTVVAVIGPQDMAAIEIGVLSADGESILSTLRYHHIIGCWPVLPRRIAIVDTDTVLPWSTDVADRLARERRGVEKAEREAMVAEADARRGDVARRINNHLDGLDNQIPLAVKDAIRSGRWGRVTNADIADVLDAVAAERGAQHA